MERQKDGKIEIYQIDIKTDRQKENIDRKIESQRIKMLPEFISIFMVL